jgi:cytochrome c551/c552
MAEAKVIISAEDRTKAAFLAVQNSLSKMTRSLGALAGAGSLGMLFKSIVDGGDELVKLNTRTGVSVEKLSEFSYGAQLAGVSAQEMASGLQKLAQNMAEATSNSGSQAAAVFKALGIEATDAKGRLRDTGTVFEDLARKFAGAADGAEKVAIAQALLGKSGDSLIPMMNQLARTSAEARRLGLTVSDEFAASAEVFNDNLTRAKGRLMAFARDAVEPAIASFNRLLASMEQGDRKRLDFLKNEADEIRERMGSETSAEYLGTFYSDSQFNEDIERLREIDGEMARIRSRLAKPIESTVAGNGTLPGLPDPGQVNKLQALLKDIEKATGTAQANILDDDRAKALARVEVSRVEWQEKLAIAKLGAADQKKVQEALLKWHEAATAEAMKNSRTPMEQLNAEWQNTTRQMQLATATWANGATDALTEFVMTGKASFTDFANSVIRDLVRIYIQKNITGQLFASMESGGFFDGIGKLFGFAHGGDFTVGGSGGTDSQLVAFRATPGEQVSVRTPAQQESGGVVNNYYIDNRGADSVAVQRLEQTIVRLNGTIEHRAVAAVIDAKRRGAITTF